MSDDAQLYFLSDKRLEVLVERTARRVVQLLDGRDEPGPDADALLTGAEVRRRLSIGTTTLWKLRRAGRLPAVSIGRAVRFRVADVDALAQQGATADAARIIAGSL